MVRDCSQIVFVDESEERVKCVLDLIEAPLVYGVTYVVHISLAIREKVRVNVELFWPVFLLGNRFNESSHARLKE